MSADDCPPSLTINDISVTEGNSGTTDAIQTVTLSAPSALTISVSWGTADGTATAPADYATGRGTLTFVPGVTSQTITNKVKGDLLNEGNETFKVSLSSPVNATIADNQGIVTIIDDDSVPALSI